MDVEVHELSHGDSPSYTVANFSPRCSRQDRGRKGLTTRRYMQRAAVASPQIWGRPAAGAHTPRPRRRQRGRPRAPRSAC